MKRIAFAATAALALVGLLGAGGCSMVTVTQVPGNKATTESRQVPLEGATSLKANVRMGVGELRLSGESSSTNAVDAQFTYRPASWKPELNYRVSQGASGSVGTLEISQPENSGPPTFGDNDNTWRLVLAGGVPSNLSLKLGVGESTIDLRGVDVRDLEVITGVGQATIDLTGERTTDVSGSIQGGVGELRLSVPKNVGVRLSGAEDGVGTFSAPGFTDDGGAKVNAAWSQPGPKIDLRLTRGVGEVRVIQVP
jgi:hypothetical protein